MQQTPSRPQAELPNHPRTVAHKKTPKNQHKKKVYQSSKPEMTRIDDYTQHLKNTRSFLPIYVRYLVADGYYYRSKFWAAVRELDLDFMGN